MGPRHILDQANPESDDLFETFCATIMSTQDKTFKNKKRILQKGLIGDLMALKAKPGQYNMRGL